MPRAACNWGGLDHAFGGGLPLRVVLLGGNRGTGKTSLSLPVAVGVARSTARRAVFFSAEGQTAAELAGNGLPPEMTGDEIEVVCSTDARQLEAVCFELEPPIVVVDSMQSVDVPGVRMGTENHARALLRLFRAISRRSVSAPCCVWALSQMNGEGTLRGSLVYQQLCDSIAMLARDELGRVVLSMDGKNRGGPIDRSAVFRFDDDGALRGVQLEQPEVS